MITPPIHPNCIYTEGVNESNDATGKLYPLFSKKITDNNKGAKKLDGDGGANAQKCIKKKKKCKRDKPGTEVSRPTSTRS